MPKQIEFVDVELRRWDKQFMHRISALSIRVGRPIATLAVRLNDRVPEGVVLLYFDPANDHQVVVAHNRLDFEQVHELVHRQGSLVAVEPAGKGGLPCKV